MEGFMRAEQDGANALEMDVSITKDGVLVLLHDWSPNDNLALARQAGLEGFKYRPFCPHLGSAMRKPVDQLNFEELKKYYGYTFGKPLISDKAPQQIPSFEELARWVSGKPSVKSWKLAVAAE